MKYFDQKAAEWDKNPMHRDRAEAIAREIEWLVPLSRKWNALEFGAGKILFRQDHINATL